LIGDKQRATEKGRMGEERSEWVEGKLVNGENGEERLQGDRRVG